MGVRRALDGVDVSAAAAAPAMSRLRWRLWLLAAAWSAVLATAHASPVVDIESDARFDPVVAQEAMKCPGNFRFGGIYMSTPPDAARKVVLFVHGANGSPRDFLEVARHLDASRYQAWFAYYATGDAVAQSGHAIAADVKALMEQHGISRLAVFAHSLGGLVAWEALDKLGPSFAVSRLVSVNTPWGGNFAAQLGAWISPSPPPMWSDLAPDSQALSQIRNSRIDRPFTLVYTVTRDDPRALGDGTISLRSQLHAGMSQRAFLIVKEIGTHDSVLCGAAAKRLSLLVASD